MESAEVKSTARPLSGNTIQHPAMQDARHDQSHALQSRMNLVTSTNHLSRSAPKSRPTQICRFYGTKKGCRSGDQCPYQHVQTHHNTTKPVLEQNVTTSSETIDTTQLPNVSEAADTVQITSDSNTSSTLPVRNSTNNRQKRIPVTKPISSLEQTNPREFQIGQIVRRYKPFRADQANVTTLKFKLEPSDPDFPFELSDGLQCILNIPTLYPQDGKPTLQVLNEDMPRGFQINVERGFDQLIQQYPKKTLLSLLNDLDKNLERFLSVQKAQTIKITTNARKQHDQPQAPIEQPIVASIVPKSVDPVYTTEQISNARQIRDVHVRQLENRMNRVPLFWKSDDGMTFNVPLTIAKSTSLPVSLQSIREVMLLVPKLYPLEPCTIHLRNTEGEETNNVELQFEQRTRTNPDLTLMAHINYLTQNIHNMASNPVTKVAQVSVEEKVEAEETKRPPDSDNSQDEIIDPERPHLRFLTHPPPEWNRHENDQTSSEEESEDDDGLSTSESDEEEEATDLGGASLPMFPTTNTERGISLSFPNLELSNIELLSIASLSISVKCDRCKSSVTISDIKPSISSSSTIHRSETCQQCSTPLTVTYRPDPIHENSSKAGYLDTEGCSTVIDMLPSIFLPTCSSCSTTTTQGQGSFTAVRGDKPFTNCRTCHTKMSFQIPEVRFLRVAVGSSLPARKTPAKESLGITSGTPLPKNGRCKHYSKSFRWFRFSCCKTVYPCDKCHDEATGAITTTIDAASTTTPAVTSSVRDSHRTEHAERMLCGFCSREQPYSPDTCRYCGTSLVKRPRGAGGKGFWEGGKGTRDRKLMSRKEGRKWKRRSEKKKTATEK